MNHLLFLALLLGAAHGENGSASSIHDCQGCHAKIDGISSGPDMFVITLGGSAPSDTETIHPTQQCPKGANCTTFTTVGTVHGEDWHDFSISPTCLSMSKDGAVTVNSSIAKWQIIKTPYYAILSTKERHIEVIAGETVCVVLPEEMK